MFNQAKGIPNVGTPPVLDLQHLKELRESFQKYLETRIPAGRAQFVLKMCCSNSGSLVGSIAI